MRFALLPLGVFGRELPLMLSALLVAGLPADAALSLAAKGKSSYQSRRDHPPQSSEYTLTEPAGPGRLDWLVGLPGSPAAQTKTPAG